MPKYVVSDTQLTPQQISSLEAQLSKLQYELTDLDTTRTDQVNRQEGVLARCQTELAALNNKYNIALREVAVKFAAEFDLA